LNHVVGLHQEGRRWKRIQGQGVLLLQANSRRHRPRHCPRSVCQLHGSTVYDSIPFNSTVARIEAPLDLLPAGAVTRGGWSRSTWWDCHRDNHQESRWCSRGWRGADRNRVGRVWAGPWKPASRRPVFGRSANRMLRWGSASSSRAATTLISRRRSGPLNTEPSTGHRTRRLADNPDRHGEQHHHQTPQGKADWLAQQPRERGGGVVVA